MEEMDTGGDLEEAPLMIWKKVVGSAREFRNGGGEMVRNEAIGVMKLSGFCLIINLVSWYVTYH